VLVEQTRDRLLVGEVEREQRLVREDQRGLLDERLRDPQPLLLAAREAADRSIALGGGADRVECLVDSAPGRCVEPPEAEAVAVQPEPHEIACPQHYVAVEHALLRDVADVRAALCRGPAVDERAPGGGFEQAKQDPEERRLPRAVRAEDSEELGTLELEAQVVPEHAVAEAEAELLDGEDAHPPNARASARTWSSCHCWNVRCGGSVSVTPTTGMPAAVASFRMPEVIGDVVWLL